MRANQVAYGFFGGVMGLAFSGPLVLHDSWMRMTLFRDKHPVPNHVYYLASFLIFPLLMMLGILGSPLVGAYAGYQCGKHNSLEPLLQTIKAPYQGHDPSHRYEINISRGMLIGYSVTLTLMSFTLINMLAGGAFGMLGTPGAAILSVFGAAKSSTLVAGFVSMAVCYIGGLLGGLFACGATAVAHPPVRESYIFDRENGFHHTSYTMMSDLSSDASSDRASFLPHWNDVKKPLEQEMLSNHSSFDDEIYFSPKQ